MIQWDLILEVKYQIVTVAAVVTIFYCFIFLWFDMSGLQEVVVFFIFSDPALLGFMFVGAMVLFEKSANTLQALVVTPLRISEYLWSKAISLTLIALICSTAMAITANGLDINFGFLFLAVSLTSLFFVFFGFIGVVRVKSLNHYLIIMGNLLVPFFLPFLNYLEITDLWIFYLIPTQASIFLFEASFGEVDDLKIIYSIVCLLVWLYISYFFAKKAYIKYLIQGSRENP
jgi:fluoroquinolone transport system permease protein